MAATDELVYEIGIDWDKIGFSNFSDSIDKGVKELTKMSAIATAAAAAAGAAIFAMGKDYAETADNLLKTSERIRTTTADIESLTFAAGDNGASMDSVTSALANLAKQQGELLRGKGDFEAWAQIDVDPSKYSNTADLLGAVADGLQGVNDVEKVNIMERLGISGDLLQTLSQGSEGLKAYRQEAEALGRISTPEMIAASQDFMAGWQRASAAIDGVMNKVKASLLESTVNPAIESFNKFVKKNMTKIADTLTRIFEALAKAAQFIFSLIQRAAIQFDRFSALIGGSERAVAALGIAMIALKWNTIKALAPAILALGALYVAFDEIMSFMEGKESFIGDFFGLFGVGSDDARSGVLKLFDGLKWFFDKSMEGWANIFALIDQFPTRLEIIKQSFKNIGQEIEIVFKRVANFINDILKGIMESVSETVKSIIDIPSKISGGIKKIGGFLGFGEDDKKDENNVSTQKNNKVSKVERVIEKTSNSTKEITNNVNNTVERVIEKIKPIKAIESVTEKVKETITEKPIRAMENVREFINIGIDSPMKESISPAISNPTTNNINSNININIDGSGTPQETGEAVEDAIKRYFDSQASRIGA